MPDRTYRRRIYPVLVSSMLLGSAPAFATLASELSAIDARLNACIGKDQSNVGMKTCTSDAYMAADKVLGKVYKSVVEQLKTDASGSDPADSKEMLKRLVTSERAWISYRDAECTLQGVEMLNGSGESLVVLNCLFAMTRDRAKSISDLFDSK